MVCPKQIGSEVVMFSNAGKLNIKLTSVKLYFVQMYTAVLSLQIILQNSTCVQ